jgi:hypothetical protein
VDHGRYRYLTYRKFNTLLEEVGSESKEHNQTLPFRNDGILNYTMNM